MSQNPYAAHDPLADDVYLEPKRTSIMAILSLVLSILCLTAPLGLLFGIAALIGIGKSRGRVGGTGLAVAGLIIGLIFSVLLGFMVFGMKFGLDMYAGPMSQGAAVVIDHAESGEYDEFRSYFTANASASMTDEAIASWVAAYQGETGAFVSTPDSFGEVIESFQKIGNNMQNYQGGGGGEIPFPAEFANGTGMVVLRMNQTSNQPPVQKTVNGTEIMVLPLMDVLVVSQSGTEYPLSKFTPIPTPPSAPEGESEGEDGG